MPARHQLSRMPNQGEKHRLFCRRKVHIVASYRRYMHRDIHMETSGDEEGSFGLVQAQTLKHSKPCQEFRSPERLYQIVIRPAIQRCHLSRFGDLR